MRALIAVLFYEFAAWVCAFVLIIFFGLRTVGGRNVPRRGPVLLIGNHESYLDPVSMGLGARRHLSYLARKTLFRSRFLGGFLRTVNCVPIDQEGVGKDGIRSVLEKLAAGHAVLVFPEGERSTDGGFREFRPGVALLLSRVDVPIVPVGIAGAFAAWPRTKSLPVPSPIFLPPTPRRLAVAVGPPRDPATLKGMSRKQMLATLRADVETQIRVAEKVQRKM